MLFYSIISLINALAMTLMAFRVYSFPSKIKHYRYFIIFTMIGAIISFAQYSITISNRIEIINFWLKVINIWPIGIVFLFVFAFKYTHTHLSQKKSKVVYLAFIPAIIFVIKNTLTSRYEIIMEKNLLIYIYLIDSSILAYIYNLWNLILALLILGFFIYFYTSDTAKRHRNQNVLIIFGITLSIAVQIISTIFFDFSYLYQFAFSSAQMTIIVIFVSLAITKYKLFNIVPEELIDQLGRNYNDIVLLMNSQGKIINSNKHATEIFGYNYNELKDMPINNIFDSISAKKIVLPSNSKTLKANILTKNKSVRKIILSITKIKSKKKNDYFKILIGRYNKEKYLEPLTICAWCKKVEDDNGNWIDLELYLEKKYHINFSHGICPTCTLEQKNNLKKL